MVQCMHRSLHLLAHNLSPAYKISTCSKSHFFLHPFNSVLIARVSSSPDKSIKPQRAYCGMMFTFTLTTSFPRPWTLVPDETQTALGLVARFGFLEYKKRTHPELWVWVLVSR